MKGSDKRPKSSSTNARVPRTRRSSLRSGYRRRIFFFLSIICLVIGFGLRFWFRRLPLVEIVRRQARILLPDAQTNIQSARLTLSHYALPEFAVQLHGVDIKIPTSCGRQNVITIEDLTIPLALVKSIWSHQIYWAEARGRNIAVHLARRCHPETSEVEPTISASQPLLVTHGVNTNSQNLGLFNLPGELSLNRIHRVVGEFQRQSRLSGFSLEQVEIRWENQLQKQIWVRFPYLELTGMSRVGPVALRGNIAVPSWLGLVKDLPRLSFAGGLFPTRAHFAIRGYWREGSIRLFLDVIKTADLDHLQLNGQLDHLPLLEVSELYRKITRVRRAVGPRLAWMSCRAYMNTTLQELEQSTVVFGPCKIEGDLGSVAFPNVRVSLFPHPKLMPFVASLKNVSVVALLNALSIPRPTGVFDKLGTVNGTLQVNSPTSLAFDGSILGPEIVFMNLGQIARQKIQTVNLHLQLTNGFLDGRIGKIALEDGLLDGQTQFKFSDNFKNGSFAADLNKLNFSNTVQNMLYGGQLQNARAQATGDLADGLLKKWSGKLQASQMVRPDMELEGVQLASRMAKSKLQIRMQVRDVKLHRQAADLAWLNPIFAFLRAPPNGDIQLRDFDARLQALPNRQLTWTQLRAEIPHRHGVITSQGSWDADDNLQGGVQVHVYGHFSRWKLQGTRLNPALEPAGSSRNSPSVAK